MAESQILKDQIIFEKEASLSTVGIIEEGSVLLQLPEGNIQLTEGDVVGLLDLGNTMHSYTYTAQTDVVIDFRPVKNLEFFQKLLAEDDELNLIFLKASISLLKHVRESYTMLRYACDSLYSNLLSFDQDYTRFCQQMDITPRQLPDFDELKPIILDTTSLSALDHYYNELDTLLEDDSLGKLWSYHGFCMGIILSAVRDSKSFLSVFQELGDYSHSLSHFLIADNTLDFLTLFCSLLPKTEILSSEYEKITQTIGRLFIFADDSIAISKELFNTRKKSYQKLLQKLETTALAEEEKITAERKHAEIKNALANSAEQLLSFARMPKDFCMEFLTNLSAYKKMPDKTATTKEAHDLRNALTDEFLLLYENIFFTSLNASLLPAPVRMFLYFGYVDFSLCGEENAYALFELANTIQIDENNQIYPFYDYLKLIYKGEKQPHKNEFDQSYPAYIRSLVTDGYITKEQGSARLSDPKEQVLFELKQFFRLNSRVTYGRISCYCPLLTEHDFIKNPEDILVTNKALWEAFSAARQVDFSCFYREYVYSNRSLTNGRTTLKKEILPEFILMPNIGSRQMMWQEAETGNIHTPATFVLPILSLLDLPQAILKLMGEFRFNICKREEGMRWNDITSPSLTSEYFDYLQFYKKNKDLSPETKESIKTLLQRSRNRYQEAFIYEYIQYLQYESNGSPRLNKISRRIMMTYCPFPKEIRSQLADNPLFKQSIAKVEANNMKEKKRINHDVYIIQRNNRGEIPEELALMQAFVEK